MRQRLFHLLKLVLYFSVGLSSLTWLTPSPASGEVELVFDAPILIAPDDTELTSPINFPPLGIPTLSWHPVSGATLYHLQIDSDQYFSSPNVLEIHTSNLQFTPTEASQFPDGVYYWRVRVEAPLPGSVFSLPFQFTKSWAISTNSPQLIAPADSAVITFFDAPAFSWEHATGASRYRFEMANSPDDFMHPIYQVDTAALAHQPVEKLANGGYFWRVIPLDPAGNLGVPSDIRSFLLAYGSASMGQIPTLLTPDQGAVLLFTPSFSWTAVPGAEIYRLEYAGGPVCTFTEPTIVITSQTSYSPTSQFPNHSNYCWRVRAESGHSIGSWSETGAFSRQWTLKAELLTPETGNPYARTPVFSWTPVAGAAYYQIEVVNISNLERSDINASIANPFWVSPAELLPDVYTWQITPYDSHDNAGATSLPFTFANPLTATVPSLVYPPAYYPPNDPGYSSADLDPVENRTAPYPLFIWQRVFNPSPYGGLLAHAYRLQVSTVDNFSQLVWQLDTQNTAATPAAGDFTPLPGVDYYWRICPLDLVLPNCQQNPANGDEWWSETRRAHFVASVGLPPTGGDTPQLLRPVNGHEQVEGTPLLEWIPHTGASNYQVQISRDSDFSILTQEAYLDYPMYASPISLAQRNLNLFDYGTFYWRVRAVVDGAWTNWSEVRRFQIASQSEWRRFRVLGNERNKLLVGSDPIADAFGNADLSTLYVSQSDLAWYIGFHASNADVQEMTYVLLIDIDHVDGSGGSYPPERGYLLSTIPAYQPEYILYVDQIGGQISTQTVYLYAWTGSGWSSGQSLSSAGGALVFTSGDPGYLELELPDSAIGGAQAPGSIAVMVVSVDSSGTPLDSVPSDPVVPGSALLSRFTSASDRMNLINPPNNPQEVLGALPTLLPMYWDWPTGSDPSTVDPAPPTPFAGAQVQISLDPQFSSLLMDHIYTSSNRYTGTPAATTANDLVGDATYYWRVRPRYLNIGEYFGAWSAPFSFSRSGFSVRNLRTNTILTTPEFRWDPVEGVSQYLFQLSPYPNFDSLTLDITTPISAYTPPESLPPMTYYWRIGVLRQGIDQPVWSSTEIFTLTLPQPTGLTPNDTLHPVHSIPSLCWQPVIIYANSTPIAATWKYRLQISTRDDFLTLTGSTETEMNCWTPSTWYPEGKYYWRVAILDPAGNQGSYSQPAVFIMQYLTPSLVSPISGWVLQTPGFSWTSVPGASYYQLDVATTADFYPLFESTITNNTSYTPLFTYPLEQIYYWRVAAYNADDYPSDFIATHIAIGSPRIWLPMVKK